MRYAIALVLLCGSASAAEWSTAATGSFQGWASAEVQRLDAADVSPKSENVNTSAKRVDGVTACRCGASCECVDCECPDCPHREINGAKFHNAAPVVKSFDVVITVPKTWHCEHCDRMTLDDGCPSFALQGKGYTVGIVRTDEGESFPRVWVRGREFVGYTSSATILAALKPVESVRVTHDAAKAVASARYEHGIPLAPGETLVAIDGVPVSKSERAAVYTETVPAESAMVMRGDYHVHVCRRCGHSWSHHDSNSGKAAPHRCANCGNYEYRIQSHSGLAPASQPVYTRQVYRSSPCPGGVCR